MSASRLTLPAEDGPERWSWPIIPHHYDTAVDVRPAEALVVNVLGVRNLRRLKTTTRPPPGGR
ncbi:hypothetical protein [Streptomyces sp. NPDC002685]|uniref:hypothetical protein n=1 Tax=Streptomyces sp. NPDC002685 TaxID=3154540 RepID=UPI0033249D92